MSCIGRRRRKGDRITSVSDTVRLALGRVRNDLHHGWECDANFHAGSFDECSYCGSSVVRSF
jgi:rRNA maturation endonuclease Nob1